ncbi:MAG: NAD(P)/FAD-dependent oxidoreductase [Bryobacterales bacterium]|nr:NAD(P)/FAD-dependent oxidoreductase [Bryobacterales bacterium]MBV9398530.1 NAD(P)/FAD-dependent oxidoreductase [Bryobacterales bacterium]
MKTVAVLGGGPAGAFAAAGLAQAGLKTTLFDEKLGWEKPCGGGLTYKAYTKYPFLIDNPCPKRLVHQTVLGAPKTGEATMDLAHPLVIYSRLDLNRMLLERAERAGAALEQSRIMQIEKRDNGWLLKTRNGAAEADYCIIAMGARNPLRDVGTQWSAADTMSALGYYVPATRERIDIQFLPKLEGYIWVFPRCGHLSVGICGKGEPAQSLRARLEAYMEERSISRTDAVFYSHMLPSLETGGWRRNRVAGEGWMAVGDSAGLVDPITGEGIYYAMRSGDLASQVVVNDAYGLSEKAEAYRAALAQEFSHDLEFAAMLAKRVFLGRFLFRTVPQRMVEFMRRSQRFRDLMQDLFAGTQPYLTLRNRLLRNLNGTLQEALMSFFLDRVIPENS